MFQVTSSKEQEKLKLPDVLFLQPLDLPFSCAPPWLLVLRILLLTRFLPFWPSALQNSINPRNIWSLELYQMNCPSINSYTSSDYSARSSQHTGKGKAIWGWRSKKILKDRKKYLLGLVFPYFATYHLQIVHYNKFTLQKSHCLRQFGKNKCAHPFHLKRFLSLFLLQ